MIGFTVNSKVKRFVKANRKEKTLVRVAFLDALDAEIERVVVASAQQAEGDTITDIVVAISKKKVDDRLICDSRIKGRIREIKPNATITKKFLTDLNTYTGAVIVTSLELVTGAYLQQLAAGDATAEIAARKQAEKPPVDRKPHNTGVSATVDIGPAPFQRQYIDVSYTLAVQNAAINGVMRIFTAKTNKQLERTVSMLIRRNFDAMGIKDEFTLKLTKFDRSKG